VPESEEPVAIVAMATTEESVTEEPLPAGEAAAIETPRVDEPAAGLVADAEPAAATLPVAPESSVAASETVDADTVATAQVVLAADPSDYTVADDGYIVVQSLETLGHYADWLQIRTQRLRDINGLTFGKPVFIGQRLKLDLSTVDREAFEQRRLAYHRDLQEGFFARHQIRETETYTIRSGDSVWTLAQRRYQVPVWLLRQYNPDLDLDTLRPGTAVQFPRLEPALDEGAPGI
jgi:membrane-bound lytic murein transglycosylase D